MKRIRLVLSLMAVLLAGVATAGEGKAQIALTGFHAGAEPIRPGGDWWGIFPKGEGYTLKPTRVSVEAVVNTLDDDQTKKTATMIRIPGGEEGVFVFRGLMCAALGDLKALPVERSWRFVPPGEQVSLPWKYETSDSTLYLSAEAQESIKVSGGNTWKEYVDYKLMLNLRVGQETTSQCMTTIQESIRDDGPQLLWSGDLDRDGKPDFIFNLASIYIDTDLALFLSSAARDGELVGLVARWNAYSNC